MGCFCGGKPEEARVQRGGSWNNNQRNARCAYRNRNHPNNRNNNNGFRVALSTLLSRQQCDPAFRLGHRGMKNGGVCSWPRWC